MRRSLPLFLLLVLLILSCIKDHIPQQPDNGSGYLGIDTLAILNGKKWMLSNGPVRGFGRYKKCPDLEIPWWTLEKGTISFEAAGKTLNIIENREGKCQWLCQAVAGTAFESTDTLNCVMTKNPPINQVSSSNNATVQIINNKFKVFNYDAPSEALGWFINGDIVSLTKDQLVIRHSSFNEKDLIFTLK